MHFIVNCSRYVISYKTAFADNFTNKKPAQDFNGDQCIDSSFLQHKHFLAHNTNLHGIVQHDIKLMRHM